MTDPLHSYHVFAGAKDARDYRHQHGTGGWIFVPDSDAWCEVILFPPHMTANDVLRHPLTKGRSGELIGSQ